MRCPRHTLCCSKERCVYVITWRIPGSWGWTWRRLGSSRCTAFLLFVRPAKGKARWFQRGPGQWTWERWAERGGWWWHASEPEDRAGARTAPGRFPVR